MILNPNSYGLTFRLGNLSSVFEMYSEFISKAVTDIQIFRNQPTKNTKREDFELLVTFQ